MIPPHLARLIESALAEDLGHGDRTTELTVAPGTRARARIVAKQDLVLSGLVPARLVFARVGPEVAFRPLANDGDRLTPGTPVADIEGPAAAILMAERLALNFLMRLSGVATLTARYVAAVEGLHARIVDTRKTTPGLRDLEKAAVRHGGGGNHRMSLSDGILIKDNHIAAAGSITDAVTRARGGAPHSLKVQVEVEDLAGLEEAIQAGAEAVLLDNMTPDGLAAAVKLAAGRVFLEASGGVNLATVRDIAASGVDIISVGALTHSATAVDLSLDLELERP